MSKRRNAIFSLICPNNMLGCEPKINVFEISGKNFEDEYAIIKKIPASMQGNDCLFVHIGALYYLEERFPVFV